MAIVVSHRPDIPSSSAPIRWCRQFFQRIWARRNLTPQERANLLASYTPPAIYTASIGGHVRR